MPTPNRTPEHDRGTRPTRHLPESAAKTGGCPAGDDRCHQVGRGAPSVGGDRPRIVVNLNYEKLHDDAAGAGLIGDGEPISAGELRRLCCDADLLPAVLGGGSEVLDVGREHRLVTPAIRAALRLRDGGCIFPGCETRTISLRSPSRDSLVGRRPNCAQQSGLVVSPPPRADRTRQVRDPRPVADPARPRRDPRNHPAPTLRPPTQPLRHARHHTGQDPGQLAG